MIEHSRTLKDWLIDSSLSGTHAEYVEALYEQFLADSASVPEAWQHYFEQLPAVSSNLQGNEPSHAFIREHFRERMQEGVFQKTVSVTQNSTEKSVEVLVEAYRALGHFHAHTDPLRLKNLPFVQELRLEHAGLSDADLSMPCLHPAFPKATTLGVLLETLQRIYSGSIGFEIMHLQDAEKKKWLLERIESPHDLENTDRLRLAEGLVAAEGLEKYLGSRFVGQKRFSLEGGDVLVPMLVDGLYEASKQGVTEVVFGMAHRGRLNVLVNIMGAPLEELYQEFEGAAVDEQYSRDVKYHKGYSADVRVLDHTLHLSLAFNPSHLEIVAPVVVGSVRVRQERMGVAGKKSVLPIVMHGDAAFAGQGVVMELFNMSKTRGHHVGGTLHIVINNQIGFTTNHCEDSRSTYYCTDVAKMLPAPVFHVNADDPEAVIRVMRLALSYRQTFQEDVVIDLVCYRRHGHNEADEPAATQPTMYQVIRKHPSVTKQYTEYLLKEGVVKSDVFSEWLKKYRDVLDRSPYMDMIFPRAERTRMGIQWSPYLHATPDTAYDSKTDLKTLKTLAKKINTLPDLFTLQPQVAKTIEDRLQMADGAIPVNWGFAENLAYATLLTHQHHVRLCGQDSGRGTFSHRHAVLHDYKTGNCHVPLQHLGEAYGHFQVIDCLLSEEAAMAFEYGYSASSPNDLVLWEAQFGDFANGAQVVVDQFLSSGFQKWQRMSGLVLLLPHGYEGQGPEHSSARLERYLQLCAQDNMQVCVPTTPAQIYHLLRRQVLRPFRAPLIVITPKSLLRHKLAVSSLEDLALGTFETILEDKTLSAKDASRVILCSGKVYFDLLQERDAKKHRAAIIRMEQLYPFDQTKLSNILKTYTQANQVVWCQEEPKNQGAWLIVREHIEASLSGKQHLSYAGRELAASPAVGSSQFHAKQQQELVQQAFGV